jgi:hypothetical protein
MAITTKNIIVDDAETPNNRDTMRLPDHQHVTRRHERSTRVAGPLLWVAVVGGVILAVIALYFAYRFVEYIGNVNEQTSDLDVVLWASIKVGATLATLATFGGCALWVFSRAYRAGVVRLPNDMPISALDIHNGYTRESVRNLVIGTMHAHYQTDQVWAQHSGLRNLNTLDLSTSSRASERPALEQPADPAPALPAFGPNNGDGPLIAQLRRIGHIDRSGRSLLVGYAAQQPQYIEMESAGFIAVAGQARVGKTTTAELMVMQAVLMGWELIICDKHGKKETSLVNRLSPAAHAIARIAIEIDDIVSAIGYWHEIGANRLMTPGSENEHTVMLVIDEFTGLILGKQLPPSILAQLVMGAVEYPKAHVHGLIIGHQWNSRLLGDKMGSNLRKAATHRLIHRIDPQDAEFLVNSTFARKAQTIKTGNAIYFGGDSPLAEIAIPFVGAQDWAYVAQNVSVAPTVAPATAAPTVTPVSPVSELETGNNPRQWGYEQRVKLARTLLQKRQGVKYLHSIRTVRAITGLQTAKVIEISREIGRSDTADE